MCQTDKNMTEEEQKTAEGHNWSSIQLGPKQKCVLV